MKFYGIFPVPGALPIALMLALLPSAGTFANSIIAGGRVGETRSLIVVPNRHAKSPAPGGSIEVATLEIDNNLPEFELALHFTGRDGNAVSGVRLEGLDGKLGGGLAEPGGTELEPGGLPGCFLWRPGRQESATVGYRMRVMVTYKEPMAEMPGLLVGMPSAY